MCAALDQLTPDQHVVVDCAAVEFIDSTGLHQTTEITMSAPKRRSGGPGAFNPNGEGAAF